MINDMGTAVVVHIAWRYDRLRQPTTTKQIAELYDLNISQARSLLDTLIKKQRVSRIFFRGIYYYGPGYIHNMRKTEVSRPVIEYDHKQHKERMGLLGKILDFFSKFLGEIPRKPKWGVLLFI